MMSSLLEKRSIAIMNSESNDFPSTWNTFLLHLCLITKFQVYQNYHQPRYSRPEEEENLPEVMHGCGGATVSGAPSPLQV